MAAARTRIERRATGRHMLASQPALAHEVGIGRPDIPGADDYGLIDVNHCPGGRADQAARHRQRPGRPDRPPV